MLAITEDDLKRVVKLTEAVPQEYRQKCFEILLGHALQGVPSRRPAGSPAEQVLSQAPITAPTRFVLPTDVKAFLSQYGLDESVLRKHYLVDGDQVRPIYQLNTTSKTRALIQLALMMALGNALSTGRFEVDREGLRARCKELKMYDRGNFSKNIQRYARMFKTVDPEEPLSLSPEGKTELADLLEQL